MEKQKEKIPFVKLFVTDTLSLMGFFGKHAEVMTALLNRMNYENIICLFKDDRQKIAEECGISVTHLNKCISNLGKANLLTSKIGQEYVRGKYMVNPEIFGKGDTENIEELRVTYKYNKNGKTIEIDKKEKELPLELPEMIKSSTYKNGMTDREVRQKIELLKSKLDKSEID